MPVKTVLTVLAVLAALPAFAAGPAGSPGGMPQMADAVPGSPGYVMKRAMGRQMMRSPEHLLMMAYHRNVANFGRLLYGAAEEGATVPPQLARVAVSEMRRSVEEMEKYRASVAGEVPPELQRMMDEHLVQVKSHLRALEELVRQDRIDSDQVKRHVEPMLAGCGAPGCAPRMGAGGGWPGGFPGRGMMMERMLQKVKGQDAELAALVREMEQAPREKKLDLLAEAVAKMVRQRAEMTEEMERRHRMMMRRLGPMAPEQMDDSDDDDDSGDHGWNDDEDTDEE
ncbi:hypothetical protein KP005_00985 [Geomonas nitrogeniifigens]|uniref:DUF5667 domain-containing protein n=2 Tax=Geomonas diazotrophica TaxID=2843197 RepID=A0ABX8JJW0_9BACT|nr:hypothetical protein KP005_00985 [Geomonas nitrogeniifigens]